MHICQLKIMHVSNVFKWHQLRFEKSLWNWSQGTHKSLEGSSKALATVTSVIDGTGSIGAAVGPFLAGAIGLNNVFYMLMASDVLALVVSVT